MYLKKSHQNYSMKIITRSNKVYKLMKTQLKTNQKPLGPDSILGAMLKHSTSELQTYVLKLFNLVLKLFS